MNEVVDYLRVAEGYCKALGGLRWAPDGEAIEFDDGTTFAFSGEIVSFLEGFAARRPLVDFNHALHLLFLLRQDRASLGRRGALQEAFQLGGKVHRNAGAFCAMLCDAVPAVPNPPPTLAIWQQVVLRWYRIMEVLAVRGQAPTVPPLAPADFEDLALKAASAYTAEDLLHWFKYGNGPVKEVARTIADEVTVNKPRSLKGVLAELAQRDRLAGAVPFVSQLVSALSLPPRRLAHHELPVGGYSDVTTAGNPEQILPSQFALDDLEFLRRFAERELLYFRREEPHSRTREELVVLLDQGVRTWGIVRLVLTAAMFALGKMADRRRLSFRVASTSGGGILCDPLVLEADDLTAQLEASDLSANPGIALERVLEEPATATRDVVLLTHPRNLAETDVATAAKRATELTRLFAVAVTERGDVQFSEVKHGVPLTLSRFHVDLEPSKPPPSKPSTPKAGSEWTGDVEPIGFPFRFGVTVNHDPFHFAFDADGIYLLAASENGMLHAVLTDGSGFEVLPRGMVKGKVLTAVTGVVGVRVGFVVLGLIDGQLAAIHYHLGTRRCKAYNLGKGGWVPGGAYYYGQLHTLVVLENRYGARQPWAIDLDTGVMEGPHRGTAIIRVQTTDEACLTASASLPAANESPRTRQARAAARTDELPPLELRVFKTGDTLPLVDRILEHDPATGDIRLRGRAGSVVGFFRPAAEGESLLCNRKILKAWCEGRILAVQCTLPNPSLKQARLLVFELPSSGSRSGQLTELTLFGDFPQAQDFTSFTLSGDNRLFARQTGRTEAEVRSLVDPGRVCATVPRGGCHTNAIKLGLHSCCLRIEIEKREYWLSWDNGVFGDQSYDERTAATIRSESRAGRPAWLVYDSYRFTHVASDRLVAACDRYGQIALFELTGPLVCMVIVFRNKVAAWLPDGTRFGSPALLGCAPTPGAAEKIGQRVPAASCKLGELELID